MEQWIKAFRDVKKEIGESIKSNFPYFFSDRERKAEYGIDKNDIDVDKKRADYPNFPYDDKGTLLASIFYESEGYRYKTDKFGRITQVEGSLRLENGIRNENAQLRAGGEDRRTGDQGGHLIGNQFGGSGRLDNLVAMKGELNQGDYKKMEMDFKKALQDGYEVDVKINVKYDDKMKRPETVICTSWIDGEKTKKVFDNNY